MIRKHFSPKNLTSSSPFRYSVLVAEFTSTTSPTSHSQSYSRSSASSHSARAHVEESKNVRVSVWWDFENCSIPAGVNVFKVAQTITAALRANGIKGPVHITAFGDVFQLSRPNQSALSLTGVNINHIPRGGKNGADRSLLVDLMYWVSQNPPPAHLFLISGDRDFASILHRLRMNNYNILLACTDTAPSVLCSAASIMWQWNTLVKGEKLNGRHFNQPPDGPHGSWYAHFRGPLENPFTDDKQPAQIEESREQNSEYSSPSLEPKIHPIPTAVLKQVRHILSLHPKGISITDFRSELAKSNVGMDKDFYGHKKFTRFLLSMPHIVKLHKSGASGYVVHGVYTKSPATFQGDGCMSSAEVINNRERQSEPSNMDRKDLQLPGLENKKSSLHPMAEVNMEQLPTKVEVPPSLGEKDVKMGSIEKIEQTPNITGESTDLAKAEEAEARMFPLNEQGSGSESCNFKTFWKKWFLGDSDKKGKDSFENDGSTSDSPERRKINKSFQKTPTQDDCPLNHASCSSTCTQSAMESKSDESLESCGEKSSRTPGLLAKIRSWLRFQSNPNSNALANQPWEEHEQQKHNVFSEESFWKDMETFIASPGGSLIISQSKTREQMAQKLQEQGPTTVRSLNEKDVLRLVDLLIFEKKWVKESPSEVSPFKLTWPTDTSSGDPSPANRLSSIFVSTLSESDSKNAADKRMKNVSGGEVSPPFGHKRPTGKSRSEILVDCQKLLDEILKELPGGYDMGSFKKLFHERYGYELDVQKLGHKKLASLLQMMPGVTIMSTMIFPYGKASKMSSQDIMLPSSDNEPSDSSHKDDESDSLWDELGPIDDTTKGREKEMEDALLEYEPSVSDDYFSDSEGENSDSTAPVRQAKTKSNDEDSVLLQILEEWQSPQEGNKRRTNLSSKVNNSTKWIPQSGSSGLGSKTDTSFGIHGQHQRPQKHYSFVADPVPDNKDKLIDGILGTLKKLGEQRMQA